MNYNLCCSARSLYTCHCLVLVRLKPNHDSRVYVCYNLTQTYTTAVPFGYALGDVRWPEECCILRVVGGYKKACHVAPGTRGSVGR